MNLKEDLWLPLLTPKQFVSFEEPLMLQVVQQEALTRLLIEKGIFTKKEFLKMVEVVNLEIENEKHLPTLCMKNSRVLSKLLNF